MQISTLRCDEHMLPVKMAELPEITNGASCGRPKVDVNLADSEVNQLTAMGFSKTKLPRSWASAGKHCTTRQ